MKAAEHSSLPLPQLSREACTPCWEKLNKLEWCNGFTVTSYGVNLGVRMNDSALLPMLRERLPRGAKASNADVVDRYFSVILGRKAEGSRTPRYYNLLYGNHSLLARSFKLGEVLEAFDSWVRFSVAELTDRRVFVHAGVVGWKNRAILIPGKSFAGKTSLVAELVKAGATYYSDEFAVLDSQGLVHPYHKPLSLREPGGCGKQTSSRRNWRARGIQAYARGACIGERVQAWRPLEATATISRPRCPTASGEHRPSPPVTPASARHA